MALFCINLRCKVKSHLEKSLNKYCRIIVESLEVLLGLCEDKATKKDTNLRKSITTAVCNRINFYNLRVAKRTNNAKPK